MVTGRIGQQSSVEYAQAHPAPARPDPNDPNVRLFEQIRSYLADMDLGGLFTMSTNGQPAGWLWDQISTGIDSEAALMIALEDTDQFKTRYGIIGELRQQAAQGKATHIPTVSQVREYEQTVTNSMRQAGLPEFMYDNYLDAQDLMRKGLSAVEVEQRLGQSWERVQNTDPAVRNAFNSFFGVQGDAALASMFLDPARTQAGLDRMSKTAYTAGMGTRMGIDIDLATADRVAGLPKTDAGIYQDLTQISTLAGSGIFDETLGESADADLDTATGVDSVFFGDGKAQSAIERRTIERKSQNASVTGGALRTNTGLSGAGTASR
jgi:hypothetical protein